MVKGLFDVYPLELPIEELSGDLLDDKASCFFPLDFIEKWVVVNPSPALVASGTAIEHTIMFSAIPTRLAFGIKY